MKNKFVDRCIKDLKPKDKPYSYGDTGHRGLMVRVNPSGAKVFMLAYHSKAEQKTKFLTIGRYGDITLADAFAAHATARAAIAKGEDPQAEKIEAREQKKARARSMRRSPSFSRST